MKNIRQLSTLPLILGLIIAQQAAAQSSGPQWDLSTLSNAPKTYPAPEITAEGVQSLYYDGPAFQGKPTRVFAFLGLPKLDPGAKAPGMVLVHGGGGTAFDRWVRLWNSRGYAAIAMDLCGCLPTGKEGRKGSWQRHEAGGPPGWGGFDQVDWPAADQWTYQAVADIVLAHSLLRSHPQVDPQRIGLTGISWGGYLTCIVSDVDPRFRFAVPVYGCGLLGENSAWIPTLEKLGPENSARWLAWWDPSVYLKRSKMPMLWVDGTNDFAYPMDSLQKSYRLPQGPRTVCLRVRMPHGHGPAGENPPEIHAFADSVLRGAAPLAKVTAQGRQGDHVWADYQATSPIKQAELNFTRDTGKWQQRKWETVPAQLDAAQHRASARLAEGVRVYYLNLVDERGLIVSSEHEEIGG